MAPPHVLVRVELHHDWADVDVQPGDTFHLLADITPQHGAVPCGIEEAAENIALRAVLTHQHGILVLHPDLLLSGTAVADTATCLRKGVLSEWFGGGGQTAPALLGTLGHSLMQYGLQGATRGERVDEVYLRGYVQ